MDNTLYQKHSPLNARVVSNTILPKPVCWIYKYTPESGDKDGGVYHHVGIVTEHGWIPPVDGTIVNKIMGPGGDQEGFDPDDPESITSYFASKRRYTIINQSDVEDVTSSSEIKWQLTTSLPEHENITSEFTRYIPQTFSDGELSKYLSPSVYPIIANMLRKSDGPRETIEPEEVSSKLQDIFTITDTIAESTINHSTSSDLVSITESGLKTNPQKQVPMKRSI